MSLKVTRGVLFQKEQTQLWMEFRQSRFGDTSTWVTLLWVDDGCFEARHFFVVGRWLVEFSIGRIISWSNGTAVKWHSLWVAQRSNGASVKLAHWSIGTAFRWPTSQLAHRSIGTAVQWHSGPMALRSNGTLVKWHSGQMTHWSNGTEVQWFRGRIPVVLSDLQQLTSNCSICCANWL